MPKPIDDVLGILAIAQARLEDSECACRVAHCERLREAKVKACAAADSRNADVRDRLAEQIGFQAEWRRQKAEEYPDDAGRNLSAAEALERLAGELRALPDDNPALLAYASLLDADKGHELVEIEREMLGSIHFSSAGPEVFLRSVVEAASADE